MILRRATSIIFVLVIIWNCLVSTPSLVYSQGETPEAPQEEAITAENVNITPSATASQRFDQLMEKAQANGNVRVIVRLAVDYQPEGQMTSQAAVQSQQVIIRSAQENLLSQLSAYPVSEVKTYNHLPLLALTLDIAGLERLKNVPEVMSIEEDRPVPATLAESTNLIGATAAKTGGYTGAGQTIAVLDTGVDASHPFLAGKVVSEACFSSTVAGYYATSVCPGGAAEGFGQGAGKNCTVGGCEHGTHVAGIAAGKAAGTVTFSGVAPDANIIAIQVFSRFDSTSLCDGSSPCVMSFVSDQIKALEHVYTLRASYSIAAVNMSLGGGLYSSTAECNADNTATKDAIDLLRSVNIATVISSGNEYSSSQLSAPGCISTAISVGSTRDGGSGATPVDSISSFSNSASFLSLLAPGEAIYAPVPGGGYSTLSGTSMAAPHVAGAWALIKSNTPGASISTVLQRLSVTGKPITDTRNNLVKPRIQVDAALNDNFNLLPSITSFSPTSGVVGTTVTINGTNFLETTAVRFNGVGASYTILSANQIRAIVPHGGTTGLIQVITSYGMATSATQFTVPVPAQPFVPVSTDWTPLAYGSATWGDYDNDRDLDLLLTGLDGANPVTRLHRNDGSGVFSEVQIGLPGIYDGAVAWGDMDNDGDLDLALSGTQLLNGTPAGFTGLYENQGSGVFAAVNAGLPLLTESSLAWADYDRDADLDLLLSGRYGSDPVARVYRNDGDAGWVNINAGLVGAVGTIAWGDYDNDDYPDILINGKGNPNWTTVLYHNEGNGTFVPAKGVYLPYFEKGEVTWNDYNSDGLMDIFFQGTSSSSNWQLYRNVGGSAFSYDSAAVFNKVANSAVAWGDYDNDGDSDVIVSGSYSSTYKTALYRNDGSGKFTRLTIPLPGVTYGDIAPADFDQDGDLDVLLTGNTNTGPLTTLYSADAYMINVPPEAPVQLTSEVLTGGRVRFNWLPAADTRTASAGLSYNLRIGTTPDGAEILSSESNLASGFRQLVTLGNTEKGTTALIDGLPAGTYYWSIQAIDASYAGSPFAPVQTFEVYSEARFEQAATTVLENTPTVLVDVILTKPVENQVTIDYATRSNTAIAGNDFYPITGQFVFAPGETRKTISVQIMEDWISEPDETFLVELSNPAGVAAGSLMQASVIIQDNDGFGDLGITFPDLSSQSAKASRSWGDFDNDNDLDVMSGWLPASSSNPAYIDSYRNDGSGQFARIQTGLPLGQSPFLRLNDFNKDETLDISFLGGGTVGLRFYIGKGDGAFTDAKSVGSTCGYSPIGFFDFNNDGHQDLMSYCTGYNNKRLVINRNNGNFSFTEMPGSYPALVSGSAGFADYDNDGYIDFVYAGEEDIGNSGARSFTYLYHNNGDGTFSQVNASFVGVKGGGVSWADYDNDGDPDLLINGCTDYYCNDKVTRLYRNNGNASFFDTGVQLPPAENATFWGDFDNDGDLDLLFTGSSLAPSVRVYRNDGGGNFTDTNAVIDDRIAGEGIWGDYDNDGDLDVLTFRKIFRNKLNRANSPPTAPSNLQSTLNGNTATLRWSAARDGRTPTLGLTYNLRVGTYPGGGNIVSTASDPASGFRRLSIAGNTGQGTMAILNNLIPGTTYYWSVQAVDSAYAGGPFAEEGSFSVPVPVVQFNASAVTVVENQISVPITISLSSLLGQPISVQVTTQDGTAEGGIDYQAEILNLTFEPGVHEITVPIGLIDDSVAERSEQLTLTLSDPINAVLGEQATLTLTIQDDDLPVVQWSSSDLTANEGDAYQSLMATLSGPVDNPVTVNVEAVDQTAVIGNDFSMAGAPLTFAPGETSKTIDLTILDDNLDEDDETARLVLSDATNAVLGTAVQAGLTIVDNDQPPTVQWSAEGYEVHEKSGEVILSITLSEASGKLVEIAYETQDGSAQAGTNYEATSGVLQFEPGTTMKTIRVPINTDSGTQEDVEFSVVLSHPVQADLGSPHITTVAILRNAMSYQVFLPAVVRSD